MVCRLTYYSILYVFFASVTEMLPLFDLFKNYYCRIPLHFSSMSMGKGFDENTEMFPFSMQSRFTKDCNVQFRL